jgi:hypothetical protein
MSYLVFTGANNLLVTVGVSYKRQVKMSSIGMHM